MTITLQAVNELIASLESEGELSIKETKVMALAKACQQLAAENVYLLNGAARELNTSWMFHKTMLGAQAALACIALGDMAAARDWLEGTTDEGGAEIPDDITVAGLQAWFDSQMISNDGNSGFLTRAEAEEAIRKTCPGTDSIVAGIKADEAKFIFQSILDNPAVTDLGSLVDWLEQHANDSAAAVRAMREGADK
ncbi:hypothetical protein [Klebsiella michiganensis]|uniref:hypothetical protein n=1 Tax=Klebsiella michiganensis TaxID=1134687 RepID=UPI001C65579E|nr:hypothetical protein [Klebsiella michiganensis]